MIKYELAGEEILKSSSKGISPLEDPVAELNQQQVTIMRMLSLLNSFYKICVHQGKLTKSMAPEAKLIIKQIKGEL